MLTWSAFAAHAPDIAAAGARLFAAEEVALLGTTSASGRPRIHPVVVKIVDTALVAFILARSPKYHDLTRRHWYALHAQPGPWDEEFMLAGRVRQRNDDGALRVRADAAMAYATGGASEGEILHEFLVDRVLWTTWLDFGTPRHRPHYRRWRSSGDQAVAGV